MSKKEDKEIDAFIAEMWASMTRVMKRIKHSGHTITDEYDLTGAQSFTLWQLSEQGPMTMGEVSELLSVTHGVATRMIDRLCEKGMVERTRDTGDRRVVRVSVTPLGQKVVDESVESAMEVIRMVFRDVSQSDREEYLSLLERIEAAQEAAGR